MTDFALIAVLFSSMLALALAYALIMNLLNKEPCMARYRTVSLMTLAFGAISLSLLFPVFTGGMSGYYLFSGMLLVLAFLVSFSLVLYNRFKLGKTPVFTQEQHGLVCSWVIVAFSLYLLSYLALLAGVAGL